MAMERRGGGGEAEDGMLRSVVAQHDGCCRQDRRLFVFRVENNGSTGFQLKMGATGFQFDLFQDSESHLCPRLERQSTSH